MPARGYGYGPSSSERRRRRQCPTCVCRERRHKIGGRGAPPTYEETVMSEDVRRMVARFYDEINAGNLVRVRDGQVIEHWGVMDAMKMMQQLGAMPDQAPA